MLCHAPEIEPIILFSAPTSDVGGYFGSDSTERGQAVSHFGIRLVIKIASSLLFLAGRLESVSNKAKDLFCYYSDILDSNVSRPLLERHQCVALLQVTKDTGNDKASRGARPAFYVYNLCRFTNLALQEVAYSKYRSLAYTEQY